MRRSRNPRLLQAAALAIAVAVFIVDLFTPTDVLSLFYAVPIFLALIAGSARFFWSLALVLAAGSMFAYESGASPEPRLRFLEINRALAGAEILVVAGLMHVLRRQAARVERTKRLLEAIVRQMPAGVVVADPGGAILLANDRAGELWREVANRHRRFAPGSLVGRLLTADEPTNAEEVPVFRLDGSPAVLRVSASPVRDAAGGIAATVMTYSDVTDMKRAAEERLLLLERERVARADAEAANRAKDQFLAAVSHDLRSPLSAIAIWANVLRARHRAGVDARAAEKIDGNVRLLGRLIDDLLDVSRISTGKLRFEMAPVDVASIIESGLDGVRSAAEAKSIALHVDVDATAPPVVGDASRLQQVVTNLLGNAVKFTPDRGAVTIRLERSDAGARLSVRDTGCGIPADFLPHVFERFSQGPGAPRQGLGLGLAIVRDIVEGHGGRVHAESAGEGRGTTFVVDLPAAPRAVTVAAG